MDDVMCYLARCKCGNVVGVCVDDGHKSDTAQFVAEMINKGYNIERVLCEVARKAEWLCKCPKQSTEKA